MSDNVTPSLQASKEYEEVASNISTNLDKLNQSMEKSPADKFEEAMKKLLPVGKESIKMAMDFDSEMTKMNTVAGLNPKQLEKLGQSIFRLSDITGSSTSEIQEGMYDAISSGIKAGDSTKFMMTSIELGKASMTDTKTAVGALTTTLNNYGLSAGKAKDISNQMMIAQNLGKTSVSEMAKELDGVTPISKAVSMGTKELFSSIAVLTAGGMKTSESMASLKGAMSNIINPSKQAKQAAKDLGINFSAGEVKSKGWIGFLGEVKTKLGKVAPEYVAAIEKQNQLASAIEKVKNKGKDGKNELSKLNAEYKNAKENTKRLGEENKDKLGTFKTLFGSVQGVNGVLGLTSRQGVRLYNDSMKQMGSKTDVVKKAFNTLNSTSLAKFQNASNSLKNLSKEFGVSMLPMITKIIDKANMLLLKFSGLNPNVKNIIFDFLKFTTVAGVTVHGMLKMAGAIQHTKEMINDFKKMQGIVKAKEMFDRLKESVVLTSIATKVQTAYTKLLSVAMNDNPIGLVIAGLMAITAAFILLYKNCKGFRDFVNGMIKEVSKGIGMVANLLGKIKLPNIFGKKKKNTLSISDGVTGVSGGSIKNSKLPVATPYGAYINGIDASRKILLPQTTKINANRAYRANTGSSNKNVWVNIHINGVDKDKHQVAQEVAKVMKQVAFNGA